MTLVVGAMCQDYAIQVSDRRLTMDGRLADDESNKATVVVCENARLIVGFTGLASAGSFQTQEWLLKNLQESGPPDFLALNLTERLVDRATTAFAENPVLRRIRPEDKRTTFMLTGFVAQPHGPAPVAMLITNYQVWGVRDDPSAWPEFKATPFGVKAEAVPPITWVERIGSYPAFRGQDVPIRRMLEEGRPAAAVVSKTVELIRDAADQPLAQGAIGKQLSSVILPADFSAGPQWNYHSDVPVHSVQFPSLVAATKATQMMAKDLTLMAVDPASAAPLAVGRTGRNAPCPCGSGTKYKYCHGRGPFQR
ncbi:MAG: SEC-C metal-binding domain-containing protein [Acidimicrobiales bacterium]